mmetsp:Transcript_7233/g.14462  ORF Transcript_7233/g.14462 Transcript_7233/m.14462 type:complete len:1084 (+) Transcript_7233:531-3782(+)
MKIEYTGMDDDYIITPVDDPNGIWSFCKFIMEPAKAAIFSLPQFAHTGDQHIVCGNKDFNSYQDNSVVAGTFGLWFTVAEAELHATEGILEAMACRKTADCTHSILRDIEANLNTQLGRTDVSVVFVSESMAKIDGAFMMPVADFTTTNGQCFDAEGNSVGVEIRPGFVAAVAKQRQMTPEEHGPTPNLWWSDFDPETDYYPVPRGCFADTTNIGTPSNPAFLKGGKHVQLLGDECVGNRTEEQMFKICLTICSHVSYGGPGTVDDRCIGVNYDEHGWAGHCHLQRSSVAVTYGSETCARETNKEDVMGFCMLDPLHTPRQTCSTMGFAGKTMDTAFNAELEAVRPYDWCGTNNYIAFWCSVIGANGATPGPHLGRNCPIGTEWNYEEGLCMSCPIHTYSTMVTDPNLKLEQPRVRDMPSVISTCTPCPPGRVCPGGTGCGYGADMSECPPKVSCGPGTFWDPKTAACLPCAADTFKVGTNNATSCQACPVRSGTDNQLGSTSRGACSCEFGFVGTLNSANAVCHLCPLNADDPNVQLEEDKACKGGEQIVVREGLYKGPDSVELYNCKYGPNCAKTPTSFSGETNCALGSTGPLCGYCQDKWILFKDGRCERCDRQDPLAKVGESFGWALFFVMFVVAESVVSFMAAGVSFERTETIKSLSPKLRRSSRSDVEGGEGGGGSRRNSSASGSPQPKPRRNSFSDDWIAKGNTRKPIQSWNMAFCWHEITQMKDTGVFSPILRILLNYGQILGLLSYVKNGSFENTSTGKLLNSFSFLNIFSFHFFIDFFETIDCSVGTTVGGKTAITMLMPIMLVGLVGLQVLLMRLCVKNVGFNQFLRGSMFGCMIMYTSIISSVLSNITPTDEINGEVYLHRDTSVKYEDAMGWITVSVFYAACFGFGLPVLVLFVYTRRMKKSLSPEQQTATRLTYGFLTKGYLSEYFYWELVVLCRRILCIIAVVSSKDPQVQTTFLMLIILVFTVLHVFNAPLNLGFLNLYEFINLACLILSNFATMVAYGSPDNSTLTETAGVLFVGTQSIFLVATLFVFYTLLRVIRTKMAAAGILSSALPAMMFKGVISEAVASVA